MNQEKRLPQVGETWWKRNGLLATVEKDYQFSDGKQTLRVRHHEPDGANRGHNHDGAWSADGGKHALDLILIHSDASGKVINQQFNGGVPMEQPEPKAAKAIKETIAEQALREAMEKVKAAQEREAGIRAILAIDAKMKANRESYKALTGERAELAAKWLPKAGKVRK